jgi:sensor histidine kinase YesM
MIFDMGNSGEKILRLIPWIVSLLLSMVIILLLPGNLFQKYQLDYYSQFETPNSRNYFTDLNGDSLTEWIEIGYNYASKEFPYLMVRSNIDVNISSTQLEQINFTPLWVENTPPLFDDFDGNGIKEAFVFTTRNDSLFLMGINPYEDDGVFLEKFIAKVYKRKETNDFKVYIVGLFDLNQDGKKEVVFKVVAGFAKNPRKFYAYDIYQDSLISSRSNFITFTNSYHNAIYNDSLGWVFSSSTYSAGNADPEKYPNDFSDDYTWIFALDGKMDFLFEPIKADTIKSSLRLKLVKEGNNAFLYGLLLYKDNRYDSRLFKYDLRGNLIKEKILERKNYFHPTFMEVGSELFIEYQKNGRRYLAAIKPELDFEKAKEIRNIGGIFSADIDNDAIGEFIGWNGANKSILVYRNNFNHLAEIEAQSVDQIEPSDVFTVRLINGQQLIAVETGEHLLFLEYHFNWIYYLKYFLWTTIYFFFVFVIYFILRYQQRNLSQKYEQERKMAELELLTIKNQIDPHFIINAINTLGMVIFNDSDEKKQSYQFLVNLSSMIRDTLQNSQKLSVSLQEEIDFVDNYLKLQQYRFNNSFEFEIKNDLAGDEKIRIPKMIIQTFAENAVKHGLAHKKEGKGKLLIEIKKTNVDIQIEISDNGIGRQQAAPVSKGSTGKGLGIIHQIITLYNRLKKTDVSYEVFDLYANEKPAGTKIIIRV